MNTTFMGITVPGIEEIAALEIIEKITNSKILNKLRGKVLFHGTCLLDELFKLKCLDNIYFVIKEFKVGFRQHVKHDYMQMLLNTDLFEQMRLYWLYSEKEFLLHLIVPEYDILK